MWFGDLVTMKWWDDLWLNESFAEWASHQAATDATQYDEAWTNFCNARKTWAYRQDQLPSTHPIAADNYDLEAVEVNFDGITYAKGASSLRQLVAWVGQEQFFAGLRVYFERHAYGNTELGDLLKALEETSGRELGSWTKEWLQTSGVNTVRPRFQVEDGRFTSFAIEQSAHPEFPTLRRHRLAVGLYDLTDGALVRRSSVEIDVSGDETDVPELVGEQQPDLVLLNDGDLTYTKVRLDERSLATVVGNIDRFSESLSRALCWGACWDMTRDGEMRASDWVDLVLRGLGVETDLFAVRSLVARTGQAAAEYTAPEHRAAVSDRWEAGLLRLVRDAEPGSDLQLAFIRGLAQAARHDDALDLLSGLLDGSHTLDGLKVDTDLRWQLLHGLAREGRADDDAIDRRARPRHDDLRPGARRLGACRDADAGGEGARVARGGRERPRSRTRRCAASRSASTSRARTRSCRTTCRSSSPRPTRSGRSAGSTSPRRSSGTCTRPRSPPRRRWTSPTPGSPARPPTRRRGDWSARAATTSPAPWPPRPRTPRPDPSSRRELRERSARHAVDGRTFPAIAGARGGQGVSVWRDATGLASGASCCSPAIRPRVRSPVANAVCMLIAASAA